MPDRTRFLAAYDKQLRTDAETPSALSAAHLGPVRLVTFAGGRSFVTYRDLGSADQNNIGQLVADAHTVSAGSELGLGRCRARRCLHRSIATPGGSDQMIGDAKKGVQGSIRSPPGVHSSNVMWLNLVTAADIDPAC